MHVIKVKTNIKSLEWAFLITVHLKVTASKMIDTCF